jgi:hypothetical protein
VNEKGGKRLKKILRLNENDLKNFESEIKRRKKRKSETERKRRERKLKES